MIYKKNSLKLYLLAFDLYIHKEDERVFKNDTPISFNQFECLFQCPTRTLVEMQTLQRSDYRGNLAWPLDQNRHHLQNYSIWHLYIFQTLIVHFLHTDLVGLIYDKQGLLANSLIYQCNLLHFCFLHIIGVYNWG